jgi:hypothetical protein
MKKCKTCIYWKQNKYQTPGKEWWGNCTFIEQGDDCQSHIVVYGNNRDGEWCGVTVETKENFVCRLYEVEQIVKPEQTIPLEEKPMSKVEASLKDCPRLNISFFGEEIELALTDWQMWPPSPADGVMGPDLEVTGMDWKYSIDLEGLYPWQPAHHAAVTALGMDRELQSKFLEAVDEWIKNRNREI